MEGVDGKLDATALPVEGEGYGLLEGRGDLALDRGRVAITALDGGGAVGVIDRLKRLPCPGGGGYTQTYRHPGRQDYGRDEHFTVDLNRELNEESESGDTTVV